MSDIYLNIFAITKRVGIYMIKILPIIKTYLYII